MHQLPTKTDKIVYVTQDNLNKKCTILLYVGGHGFHSSCGNDYLVPIDYKLLYHENGHRVSLSYLCSLKVLLENYVVAQLRDSLLQGGLRHPTKNITKVFLFIFFSTISFFPFVLDPCRSLCVLPNLL